MPVQPRHAFRAVTFTRCRRAEARMSTRTVRSLRATAASHADTQPLTGMALPGRPRGPDHPRRPDYAPPARRTGPLALSRRNCLHHPLSRPLGRIWPTLMGSQVDVASGSLSAARWSRSAEQASEMLCRSS